MRLRRSALLLSALLLLACSAVLLVTGQQQQQPATVDGLTTTTEDASSPPPAAVPSSSSSTSMPSTVRPAPAAASPAPAPATPSALAAPIDRAVFRTVAKCSSLVKFPSRRNQTSSSSQRFFPSVKSLNATLEMDATPSYSSVWRGRDGNDGGWRPGRSRLNVSSLLAQQGSSSAAQGSSSASGGSPDIRVSARLHPLPCLPAGTALFGPLAYSASTAYTHNGEEQGKEGDMPPDGQPAEILGLKVSSSGGKNSSSSSSSSQVAGSATFPFLVDYDSAGSVVLYADGENGSGRGTGVEDGGPTSSASSPVPLACCSLEPPAPDFPSEWSAVIEANVRDKGYTMVVRQLYSASNKKVRLDVHSLGNDRVVVQDYKKGTATFIDAPNATHPFGSCEVVGFDELAGGADAAASSQFGGGGGSGSGSGGETSKASAKDSANAAADGSAPVAAGFSSSSSTPKPKQPQQQQQQQKQQQQEAFLPTAAALAFAPGGGAARARFVPSAAADVRGIPAETWARRVEEPATNSSFDLLYLFPVNAWLASGEDYHRLLKAIVVNGTQGGQRVYQEFHFVDFRPYGTGSGNAGGSGIGGNASANANGTGIPAEAFDPCEIAPGGAGCGCGPKKKIGAKPAGTADFAAFPAASTSSSSSPRDFSAQQQELQPQQTMGLLPSQVGSYVFFLFLGLVAGLLGAFGVPALVGCCCRGRRDRSFGRFDEGNGGGAPPTSAVTSAA